MCWPLLPQALNTKHAGLTQNILVTEARSRVGGNITSVSVRVQLSAWRVR